MNTYYILQDISMLDFIMFSYSGAHSHLLFFNSLDVNFYPVFGTLSDFDSDIKSSNVISDLACPAHAFHFSDCNLEYSNSSDGCLSYSPQPVLTCIEG